MVRDRHISDLAKKKQNPVLFLVLHNQPDTRDAPTRSVEPVAMGGMFSKSKARVLPEVARTSSAPAAMGHLGRCSPDDASAIASRIGAGRPASAEELINTPMTDSDRRVERRRLMHVTEGGGAMGAATAVAALRPFEKLGCEGTRPSGVVPEGSQTVSHQLPDHTHAQKRMSLSIFVFSTCISDADGTCVRVLRRSSSIYTRSSAKFM